MTLDQAIIEVQQICGWRSDKVPQITAALAYAQSERERPDTTIPWFLKKTNDQAITTVYQQMGYPYPSDYLLDSEEMEGNMYIYLMSSPGPGVGGTPPNLPGNPSSRTVFLKKQNFEHSQVRYFGEWPYVYYNPAGVLYDTGSEIGPGVPRDYVLTPNFVVLYPAPDGVYYVSWTYWAADTLQALGQTNKWLTYAPWALIGDAAAKICSDLGNDAGKTTALQLSQAATSNLFRSTINRSEAGRRRSLGSRL